MPRAKNDRRMNTKNTTAALIIALLYEVPRINYVTLKIFDVFGREVATLVDEIEEPGYKSVEWDAIGVASGVYFYRLTAGDYVATKKMLVLK